MVLNQILFKKKSNSCNKKRKLKWKRKFKAKMK